MTWPWLALGLAGLVALLVVAYWQLIIAEGTYLGPRVVAWTYDLVASRYDAIKQFDNRNERWFVASPLLGELATVEQPLILDVATGTGRLPQALLRERFRGTILALDLSSRMLRQARRKLQAYGEQVSLIRQDASHLPFDDDTFDAVACLEALEFMPDPLETLAEMVRVLAPGGVLCLTNRVGWEARLLPGRAMARPEFEEVLMANCLLDIRVRSWQTDYDLALARMGGQRQAGDRQGRELTSLLRCPACGAALERRVASLACTSCGQAYPIQEGVLNLVAGKRPESR
jgi:SAM-dependent methyltransferase